MRRLVAAAESEAIGYGGVSAVARATGVSRRAITEGIKELGQRKSARKIPPAQSRIRRKGAGRKRTTDKDPALLEDLDLLLDPATRGDPESPLRWTCKSVRRLAEELQREGHAVSYQTVAELLHALDYSLQANQKTLEGSQHADRDKQFEYINGKAQRYLKQGEPVISVDTKKKELVGDFKNGGREWQIKGEPEPVRVHDFEIREPGKGKVAPYGVYDLGRNPSQVVYPIRSHFAFARFTNFEIVNAHWFRLPLDLPLPPAIFEIAYQFLFLCVHRYDRLALLQISLRLSVDVLKLLIPIRMLASFQGLLIGLQTVVQRM